MFSVNFYKNWEILSPRRSSYTSLYKLRKRLCRDPRYLAEIKDQTWELIEIALNSNTYYSITCITRKINNIEQKKLRELLLTQAHTGKLTRYHLHKRSYWYEMLCPNIYPLLKSCMK